LKWSSLWSLCLEESLNATQILCLQTEDLLHVFYIRNGPEWWRLRSAFQRDLSRPQSVRLYLSQTDLIIQEFIDHLKIWTKSATEFRDFSDELSRLFLECKYSIILCAIFWSWRRNKQFGLWCVWLFFLCGLWMIYKKLFFNPAIYWWIQLYSRCTGDHRYGFQHNKSTAQQIFFVC
jgi:hypothetical protein